MKKIKKPQIRYLKELKEVIFDQQWLKSARNFPVYYIYRGLKRKNGLRYDITVIPPRMLGKEFVRTKGNRNSKKFQELYIVLKGKAIFLMQKTKGKVIENIVAVEAKGGESVIFPPKYAAIIINPSKKELKIANWVSVKNENIYEELERMKGAGYYYTKSGWTKNKNYAKVPQLRFKKPLKSLPSDLSFLK